MFLVRKRAVFLSLQILKQWVLELDTAIKKFSWNAQPTKGWILISMAGQLKFSFFAYQLDLVAHHSTLWCYHSQMVTPGMDAFQ